MKTMIATNRKQKTVTLIAILTMIFSMGYGQGKLVEGAAILFQSITHKETEKEFTAVTVNLESVQEAEKNFTINKVMNVFDRKQQHTSNSNVVASFTVHHLDVAYEAEMTTENWMETSLSEHIETIPEVESWMTSSLDQNIEHHVEVESWMTSPMTENLEELVVTEQWMTTPLTESYEEIIFTEEWMTTPLDQNFESSVSIESWMTQPLYAYNGLEQSIEAEDWMTDLLYTSAESGINVEEWMTELLR